MAKRGYQGVPESQKLDRRDLLADIIMSPPEKKPAVRISSTVIKRVPEGSVPDCLLVGYTEPTQETDRTVPTVAEFLSAGAFLGRNKPPRQFGSSALSHCHRRLKKN